MTEKRYKLLERVVVGTLTTVALGVVSAVLLGVYALANLVF